MTGSFNGSVKADQLSNIDLSTMTLSAAMDIPNKKAKVSLDAPPDGHEARRTARQ
jgi:hypothetical protein